MAEYAYIYNLTPRTVPIEAAIPFDSNGIMTAGILHPLTGSNITILNSGIYAVTFTASGTEPNQIALFQNGSPVPGSIYGSGAGTQQNSGQTLINVVGGDVISVVNHSSASAVGLASPIGGTQTNTNASILIQKVG